MKSFMNSKMKFNNESQIPVLFWKKLNTIFIAVNKTEAK
jgi:hypothetical protein